jgi:hypothetical protein
MATDKALAQAQRREALALSERILEMTNRIPPKILRGNYQDAVAFKKDASKARKMAETAAQRDDLAKMRTAFNLIEGYYK